MRWDERTFPYPKSDLFREIVESNGRKRVLNATKAEVYGVLDSLMKEFQRLYDQMYPSCEAEMGLTLEMQAHDPLEYLRRVESAQDKAEELALAEVRPLARQVVLQSDEKAHLAHLHQLALEAVEAEKLAAKAQKA